MEKEPESIAVTMKQDYAPSEVYSSASEAPPAYKHRQANSVKIAKIIALTVIASCFILGSFILGSTYLQARASCDQVQALDAILNKELMLEAMQQELPKAEALLQSSDDANNDDLQSLDKVEPKKPKDEKLDSSENSDDLDSDADNYSDSDESSDMNNHRVHIKLPLDLDLSDLANVLQNSQKSRMNCVVERRRSEEFIDAPSKTMNLPFGVNLSTDPKKQKITGERMAIFCETGNEEKNEDTEPIRQVLIPIPPVRSFGGPITHMPQQMPPQPMMHQMPPRQFPPTQQMMNQQMPPVPAQMMQAPRPGPMMMRPIFPQMPFHMQQSQQPPQMQQVQQPPQQQQQQQQQMPQGEIRIHVQRIQIPEPIRQFLPPHMQGQEAPEIQVREVPVEIAFQKMGISPDELKDIQEMAAHKFAEQLRHLIDDSDSDESGNESNEDARAQQQVDPQAEQLQQQQPPKVQEEEDDEEEQQQQQPQNPPQILQMGRSQYARSLVNPIDLPVRMMQQEMPEAERPHYVQPRSVRSVDNVFQSEKRVKRCACDCSC